MTTYYKFLNAEGLSPYAFCSWPLPVDGDPGEWVEVEGELEECSVGIHACTEEHLLDWLDASLYELEYDGEVCESYSKVYGRRARLVRSIDTWNDQSARLFAADCAERVADLWVAPDGCEWEPGQIITIVRQFSFGMVSRKTLTIAQDAAWGAAWAAWGAARAAGGAAGAAGGAAGGAAWGADKDAVDAAWGAAGGAAGGAARDARDARDAEREWQNGRLMQYLRNEVDLDAIRESVSG